MARMTIRALIPAAAASLALAACGGDDEQETSSPRERAQEGALAFARCMRERGIDFPDPQVGENGMIRIGPGPGRGGPGPEDPKMRAASEKCREHLEVGGEAPELPAEARDAFVAYARCMREEGVDMPDPDPNGGVRFRRGDPNAPDPESPEFKRADEACRRHLADLRAPEEAE
jgi:hypothetical protein